MATVRRFFLGSRLFEKRLSSSCRDQLRPRVLASWQCRRHVSSKKNEDGGALRGGPVNSPESKPSDGLVNPPDQADGPSWWQRNARSRPTDPMGKRYSAGDLAAKADEASDAVFRKHFVVDGVSSNFTEGSYINKPREFPSEPTYVYTHEFDVHHGGLAVVVEMGNPQKANSLSTKTLQHLEEIFLNLAKRDDLRAVILTGCKVQGPPIFSAGANIREMDTIASPKDAQAFIGTVFATCEAVRKCPVPTIARIDGLCFGAGVEIASCCDFRYATWQSLFSMKEVALGIPSVIQARMLANIIGWQETKKMVLLATDYSAKKMRSLGFLDGQYRTRVYLDQKIDALVNIIANNGPKATRAQKALNRFWEENPLGPGIVQGIESFTQMWEDGGTEPKQYMGAWLERSRRKEYQSMAEDDDDDGAAELPEPEVAKPKAWNFLKLRDYSEVSRS